MSAPDAPPAPDYRAAAEETAAGNMEMLQYQTRANRPNQITPFGTSTWSMTPFETGPGGGGGRAGPGAGGGGGGPGRRWRGAPPAMMMGSGKISPPGGRIGPPPGAGGRILGGPGGRGTTTGGGGGGPSGMPGQWTQTIELTPESQRALEAQQAVGAARSGQALDMLGGMRNEFGEVMDWDQFGDFTKDLSTGAQARNAAEEASYSRATSRLDPRFSQQRESTEAQLRNQGLRPGDEAYDTAMANLGREETDAYNQAMYSAILTGGQEAAREQGMDLTSASFGNTVRQAQIGEEMQRRGFTLNEINALLSGQQVSLPSMPGFTGAGRTQGPDYMGAAQNQYGASLDAFNADQAFMNSLLSGAGSGAAMMFSDIRLKKDIKKVGTYNGNNYYTWTYIWGQPGFGVMAHEMPLEYLAIHDSGYFMVDYGRL